MYVIFWQFCVFISCTKATVRACLSLMYLVQRPHPFLCCIIASLLVNESSDWLIDWLYRWDVSALYLSAFISIQRCVYPASAAVNLSVDDTWSGRLPARSLPVTDNHQERVGGSPVWSHVYLRPGSRCAPGCRARGWSRTDRPHLSLAGLRSTWTTVQGQVQADQPHPSAYGRTAFPVSVSGLRKSVRAKREPQDSQANAHRSVTTHLYVMYYR